ncbi:conjugal transfer mating pair stabilization protein TraN [Shewanella sairae]|uniref:Conjugal transfer mating pair stabilization protein TraN n=1 Tax=Shewanella sairae TaxID=190310 RepID=A0ABQ4PQE1_9GAMM|nr:type-F conjugative transfer system mating-pair stabilization protein TraN [Shewanella sairae]MCL1132085.1 type-F conjugative transfer system mating-pair stabilization protein TraN [Shewanella sairae]GIU51132.1 conjugal transfer mating pair stabilization protein TraN [Shewanella sairae]
MPLLNKSLLASALLLFPITALANQGTHYYNTVDEAKSMVTQSLANPNVTNFDVNDYCKDEACKRAIANPEQSKYFGNDKDMILDGQLELHTDDNAANLQDSFNNRPAHVLDLNDPAYRRAQGYMDESYEISHGISTKYHDCEKGKVCDMVEQPRQCSRPTGEPATCYHIPVPGQLYVREQTTTPSYSVQPRTTLNISMRANSAGGINDVLRIIHLPEIKAEGWRNGKFSLTVANKTTPLSPTNMKRCRGNNNFYVCEFTFPAMQIAIGETWTAPELLITYREERADSLTINAPRQAITLDWTRYQQDMGWEMRCPPKPRDCNDMALGAWTCTEEGGIREINGMLVHEDCWRRERPAVCIADDTCLPMLNPPDFSFECKELNQTCKVEVEGVCVIENVNLQCDVQECYDNTLVCGEKSFCLDGDCYVGEGEENPNFSTAVSGLAGAAEAAESFDADTLQIFTGKPASCSKKPVGLSDCCSDDGWGNDIGLTDCSSEEKGLMEAKEKGLTIDLGEYCAEKVLGVCIRKKKGYCQFDSKMARIIQEQGRVQLDVGFGSAKHPNCTGITPEQLQFIDFSQVDFSDFYEDLDAGLALPDMDEITDRIKDKYQDQ